MDHIARVEVAEAVGDIGQLVTSVSVERVHQGDTYESKSVCIRVFLDVLPEGSTRHPVRNELEGIDSGTQEWQDVRVYQVFPDHSLLVEGLWISSALTNRKNDGVDNVL